MSTTYDFGDSSYLVLADARAELDRVFELCHGCRLCWNLCPSFASLFELVDAKTDGLTVALPHEDQDRVVDECYQCKLCYIKCPYIPPHQWQLDFPALMLRAFAARHGGKPPSLGDRLLASTDLAGRAAVASHGLANATLRPGSVARKIMQKSLGIAAQRVLHPYAKQRFTTWWRKVGYAEAVRPFQPVPNAGTAAAPSRPSFLDPTEDELAAARPESATTAGTTRPSFLAPTEDELAAARPGKTAAGTTAGTTAEPGTGAEAPENRAAPAPPKAESRRVTLFPTCLVEYQDPSIGKATARVLRHNGCDVACAEGTRCCGMPQLDAGNLDAFLELAEHNVTALLPEVRAGRRIVVPQPTCNYVLRREYPAHLGTDAAREVGDAVVDPAEYLMQLHRGDGIADDFTTPLGKVGYHAACHQRAQQQGLKARDLLRLVPGTEVHVVEGCTGIDGTWGYRARNYDLAKQVVAPTAAALRATEADTLVGDCLLADQALAEEGMPKPVHPMQALARAYGLEDQ